MLSNIHYRQIYLTVSDYLFGIIFKLIVIIAHTKRHNSYIFAAIIIFKQQNFIEHFCVHYSTHLVIVLYIQNQLLFSA